MEANSFGYFLSIYQQFAQAENESPRTIESVSNAVRKFDSFLGGYFNPRDIQAENLRQYIRQLQQQTRWSGHPTIRQNHGNLSPYSIASYVRSIRAFFSWMERENFIDHNPFAQVRPPKAPLKVVTPLTPGEVTQLIKVTPRDNHHGYRDISIIITLYGTALRISELLDLSVADVNFISGQIKVMGKGKKERSVFSLYEVFLRCFGFHCFIYLTTKL